MSKKKAFSGSTMTLKDFHGGSIPSDLPLPSAPGVVVRPSDRVQIPNAWGNPISRSDHNHHLHRSRPESSGTNRNFEEKPTFLSHPAHIGRNFDEDERKPLDGVSVPRRAVSDESIRVLPVRYDPKQVSPSAGRMVSSSSSHVLQSVNANPVRYTGSTPVQSSSQVGSSVPNAWGTRKEVVSVVEPVQSSNWSGPNAISRFAQASALEKVSSGRWQSKHQVVHQPEVEVIRFSDDGGDFLSNDVYHNLYSGYDLTNERGEVTRGRYVEKSRAGEDETVEVGKVVYQERTVPSMYVEAKERSLSFNHDGIRPAFTESKLGGSQLVPPMLAEVGERPKIKLLPRSKPLESSEPLIVDYKQAYQEPSVSGHVETVNESHANENLSKPGSSGSEGGKRAAERPRLHLKPRSQPREQSEGIAERERKSLFGGARPRELVLKERGVDDVIDNLDVIQSPNRTKGDHPKSEIRMEPVIATPVYGQRADNFLRDQKNAKGFERKDHRAEPDKIEQRASRRNDNWRNNRDHEKHQQQERRPEPETWRKPMEQPNSSPPDAAGMRYGKAASALELAQAFSRSNSGPKTADRVSGQRGLPAQNQIPFSRLTDTREFYSSATPRRQINGY